MGKKALNKNPDEFYFHMINSKQVDGVHKEKGKDAVLTDDQIKLMQTQDIKYIVNKRTSEKNTHTFFVDSEKEKEKFSVAKRLATHPNLLSRTHNRPKLSDIKSGKFNLADVDESLLEEIGKKSGKAYKELHQRMEREKQLGVVQRKMEMKAALREKIKPIKLVVDEQKSNAPVYLWPQ